MATLDIAESKTLLEFLLDLLNDKDALADFRDDPHTALRDAGLGDCTVDDIKELLPVVLEKVDAEKCARYEDDCDDDKCWDAEPKHDDHHEHHHKPVDCDDEGRPAPHCSPTDQVVAHLNYVTNNYSYDSHDTFVENNNITKIWAGDDAEIDVTNNNVTAGSDGVAVGGDNNGEIVDGDGNVVGDDNQVSGQGSTTAFGLGSATSTGDIDASDHGAVSVGPGLASTVDSSTDNSDQDNSIDNSTDNSEQDNSTVIDTDTETNTDNSTNDSNNLDTSDSGNIIVEDNTLDLAL
jgi:hypothetical protein